MFQSGDLFPVLKIIVMNINGRSLVLSSTEIIYLTQDYGFRMNAAIQIQCIFSVKLNKSFCLLTCIFLFVKCKHMLCLEKLVLLFLQGLDYAFGHKLPYKQALQVYTILIFFHVSLVSGDIFNTNRLCVSGFFPKIFQRCYLTRYVLL